jgi:cell wall-associated NlpC family hydrolase
VGSNTAKTKRRLAVTGMTLACALLGASSAQAQSGGTPPPGGTTTTTPTTPTYPTAPPGKAKLTKRGVAIPPADAPPQVVAAINAGNQIRLMPYRWGGGHRSFYDTGYDCSGAVSYVLYGAGLIESPMPSGPLASSWGSFGRGRWITVYANAGHTYMVVAGLRFDTSAVGEKLNQGSGPRWRATKRKPAGYTAKYYPSL